MFSEEICVLPQAKVFNVNFGHQVILPVFQVQNIALCSCWRFQCPETDYPMGTPQMTIEIIFYRSGVQSTSYSIVPIFRYIHLFPCWMCGLLKSTECFCSFYVFLDCALLEVCQLLFAKIPSH